MGPGNFTVNLSPGWLWCSVRGSVSHHSELFYLWGFRKKFSSSRVAGVGGGGMGWINNWLWSQQDLNFKSFYSVFINLAYLIYRMGKWYLPHWVAEKIRWANICERCNTKLWGGPTKCYISFSSFLSWHYLTGSTPTPSQTLQKFRSSPVFSLHFEKSLTRLRVKKEWLGIKYFYTGKKKKMNEWLAPVTQKSSFWTRIRAEVAELPDILFTT